MHKIIRGCNGVLEQAETFINSVSDSGYTTIIKPYFISSCGQHMRHILDHFITLMDSCRSGVIDYDKRQRGSQLETSRSVALQQISKIQNWLVSIDSSALELILNIKTEVSINNQHIVCSPSSLGRELIFCSSHAIHHFSMISIAAQMQDLQLDANFGIAPATSSFLRAENRPCVL